MRGGDEQSTSARNEDGEKEWKTKGRSNWRYEQNAFIWTPVSCSSVNEIPREAPECMENSRIDANLTAPSIYSSLTQQACQSNQPTEPDLTRRNKFSFSSLPPLHISQQAEWSESQNLKNQHLCSMDTGRWVIKSCPEQIAGGRMPWISMNQHSPPVDATEKNVQKKYFTSHLSMNDVNERLQKGDIFKALFRINAHYIVEAYCKIDGIPVDVLIHGSASQNRAVEGDIVAIKMNPFSSWSRMKGTSEAHDNMHPMEDAKKRLDNGDDTVESELVAARIDEWVEESSAPKALVVCVLGRGSRVESHIDAILFQNAILTCEFSHDSLSCLPHTPWKIPHEELQCRRDLRNLCIFTVDSPSALDLDDAFSVQKLANGIFRVGVHIADVSHFVLPDTALDKEARIQSTSVYLLQRKIPMLPPLLAENIGSLNPGVDRLAFSLFLDINHCGDVKDCWIGRTVICSCCKLSYEHSLDIIDGLIDADSSKILGHNVPQLHGQSAWLDVISSVRILNEISKTLKEKRFRDGALKLENPKIVFLFDEFGIPYDSSFHEQKDSNFLVEEFVLLANRTVAEVISRTFPDRALLRRHPEPILRKLKEFESFCSKQVFELDTSSSALFQQSLEQIRIKLHDDPLPFDVVISYATRPMQLATYFCNERGSHYALAAPLYTHFTSPLRRYPDIVVHRTLAAAVEAEELYLKHQGIILKINIDEQMRCFTGIHFDKDAADSLEGREALSSAALRHGVPCSKLLSDVALHCNNRKLASNHAADACDKLDMWVLLKEKKILFSYAKVLGLGSKFMTLYIQKLGIERRIYYEKVEDLAVEWLDATSTLVLSFLDTRRSHRSRDSIKWKALEDVALVISPCDLNVKERTLGGGLSANESGGGASTGVGAAASDTGIIEPAVFPLTIQLLSTLPVALHAVGGDDGAIEIGVRLYMSSYLR